jgi:Domain of unknown function (DUF5667)
VKRAGALARALALALLSYAEPAAAGHGMVTSFATIEWLPEPGRTPDEFFYFLDTWGEERELAAANGRRETLDVSLRIARKKLAELEAMVRVRNARAARVAADRYRALVERALAELRDGGSPHAEPGDETKALAHSLCQALLEHQYILSVDYETLPRESRRLLAGTVAAADAAYQEAAPRLSQKDRDPFLFKQNEVRWSVRTGMRDD